jgi:Probable zinc-ribbon domain
MSDATVTKGIAEGIAAFEKRLEQWRADLSPEAVTKAIDTDLARFDRDATRDSVDIADADARERYENGRRQQYDEARRAEGQALEQEHAAISDGLNATIAAFQVLPRETIRCCGPRASWRPCNATRDDVGGAVDDVRGDQRPRRSDVDSPTRARPRRVPPLSRSRDGSAGGGGLPQGDRGAPPRPCAGSVSGGPGPRGRGLEAHRHGTPPPSEKRTGDCRDAIQADSPGRQAMTITSLPPDRVIYDAGTIRWRGGVVWSLDGATSTIKLHLAQHMIGTRTVATSLIPGDARTVGNPIACRVEGDGASSYVIIEIIGSHAGGVAVSDEAAAVARGEFRSGVIPRSITKEPRVLVDGIMNRLDVEYHSCKDCGDQYTLTSSQISWYVQKGFNIPKCCVSCRARKRAAFEGGHVNSVRPHGSEVR